MTREELQKTVNLTDEEAAELVEQAIEVENTTEILTSVKVDKIFYDCLCEKGKEFDESTTIVDGITMKPGFDKQHISAHKDEIAAMLLELPEEFMASGKSGGWSFLMACNDKHGRQWTDLHLRMEQLFLLGLAIKKVKLLLPREAWFLSGGVPYYAVIDTDR